MFMVLATKLLLRDVLGACKSNQWKEEREAFSAMELEVASGAAAEF